ncbi:YhcH/YjgK/YiaL family protein [Rubritalea tangerina]|uniref:YhcH/YjgK/YiaL family protein n=2 Tax=Rubritalea tangerina TaxID=430798 RepID=A0ABW4ZAR8_9BACT
MTITSLQECVQQAHLTKPMQMAIDFLKTLDPSNPPAEGKIDIDGDTVFAFSQRYDTKEAEDVLYEAHRDYLDIQYLVSGSERMGWTPIDQLDVTQAYDQEDDFLLGKPKAEHAHTPFTAGQVMILHPSDAHAPGINLNGQSQEVRKIVLKVAIGPVA